VHLAFADSRWVDGVNVIPRERDGIDFFRQLHLEHGQALMAEGRLRAMQVELPHAVEALIEHLLHAGATQE